MFKVVLSRRAAGALERFDTATARRVIAALEDLQHTPFLGKDIKKLRGDLAGKYRLRIGRVRAVYSVFEEEGIVRVDDLGHRGDIY